MSTTNPTSTSTPNHNPTTPTASPTPSQKHQPQSQPLKPQTFTLLLFATASTYTSNTSSLTLPAPTTLHNLFTHLEQQYPGINQKILRSSQIVINLEYVDCEVERVVEDVLRYIDKEGGKEEGNSKREGEDVLINPGDEVAVVPPVSSG